MAESQSLPSTSFLSQLSVRLSPAPGPHPGFSLSPPESASSCLSFPTVSKEEVERADEWGGSLSCSRLLCTARGQADRKSLGPLQRHRATLSGIRPSALGGAGLGFQIHRSWATAPGLPVTQLSWWRASSR